MLDDGDGFTRWNNIKRGPCLAFVVAVEDCAANGVVVEDALHSSELQSAAQRAEGVARTDESSK